jgi:hypothetical protein
MHTICLLTRIFYFRQYLITILLCSPPALQWPLPNILEDLIFHLGCHFCSVLGWLRYPLQKPLPGRKNSVHAWALLTWEISRSPFNSCLVCMAREVTLTTHIFSANWSQPSPGAGVHCCAKWVAHPRGSQVGFCAFFCTVSASSHDNMLLSHLFHMELYLSWWFVWISVRFLPRKVSILMYYFWSLTVTVPEAPADAVSNTR